MKVEVCTGRENMAADLAMVDDVIANKANQLWRVYTWQPWSVSLGKHQAIEAIDVDAARSMGIDVVHRPTGGRAVLHADELTYCVVVKGTPSVVYHSAHQLIHKALCVVLGSDADMLEFDTVGTDLRSHYASGSEMGQVCFASSAKSEIMVQGRKLVGSAQRVFDTVVLQHGSILCGPSHLLISQLVNIPDERRSTFRQALTRSSVSLSEVANKVITPLSVAEALTQQLEHFSM